MSNELQTKLNEILNDKNINLLPEHLKAGVTCLGVEGNMESGVDTSDATATAGDLANGKTAYVNGEKVTGTLTDIAVGHVAAFKWVWQNWGNTSEIRAYGEPYQNLIFRREANTDTSISYSDLAELIGLTAEQIVKGQTVLGVEGTGGGDSTNTPIKLYETIEEMNADTTAKDGDLAIIYRNE